MGVCKSNLDDNNNKIFGNQAINSNSPLNEINENLNSICKSICKIIIKFSDSHVPHLETKKFEGFLVGMTLRLTVYIFPNILEEKN